MSNLPALVRLTAYHGDSWQQSFRMLAGSNPVDFTGASAEAWAQNGSTPITLEVEIGPEPGVITISADPGVLPVGELRYDLEVTGADGTVTTWVAGPLTVSQDVTNQ